MQFENVASLSVLAKQLSGRFKKRMYEFHQGTKYDVSKLGLKGAAQCEMMRSGIPIPPGFILSTLAYRDYLESNSSLDSTMEYCVTGIKQLEKKTQTQFGGPYTDGVKPLLLCVRASTILKTPNVMNSVLCLGINDQVVANLAGPGHRYIRYALDTHRRFLQNFGVNVLGIPRERYDHVLQSARKRDDVTSDRQLTTESLAFIVEEFKSIAPPPSDPWEQLRMTIQAIYRSWGECSKAPDVARFSAEHMSSTGVAVLVQRMVAGNLNSRSGTGVCCIAGAASNEIFGAYSRMEEGETDHTPVSPMTSSNNTLQELRVMNRDAHRSLMKYCKTLREKYSTDLQYVEFVVEDGEVFMLDTDAVKADTSRYTVDWLVVAENPLHNINNEGRTENMTSK